MQLKPEQLTLLESRFKHFDADRCAPLFHPDQPDGGMRAVRSSEGKKFPAARMSSESWWYLDKAHRPEDPRTPGRVIKAQSTGGFRRLLFHADVLSAQEVLLVEGEGHAIAAASVGYTTVVSAGGVNTLAKPQAKASDHRASVFKGRRVKLLFDPDAAGVAAVSKAAQTILDAGATHVAIIQPEALPESWTADMDLEDWLATFETPAAAMGALVALLGGVDWQDAIDPKELVEDEPSIAHVQSARLQTGTGRTIVVMTYSEADQSTGLAVFGPEGVGHDGKDTPPSQAKELDRYGDGAAEEEVASYAWQILDSWRYADTLYLPDVSEGVLHYLVNRTLVLPPKPAEKVLPSIDLWRQLRTFMQEWVVLDVQQYDLLVAYVLMSYRLEDAGFEYVPYLRFHGPPGCGKGRAVDVVRSLMWRTFTTQPSNQNLHRIVDYLGDVTLVVDEFHLDRGRSRESRDELIDTLNLGNKRGQGKSRVVEHKGRMEIKHFDLFGPKVFAGYGADEHEALARRTINLEMRIRDLPPELPTLSLPPEFYARAEELRGELLAWRAAKLTLGQPEALSPRAVRLVEEVGPAVGQVFWPLVEMVPAALEHELDNLMRAAGLRQAAAVVMRETSEESYLLECVLTVLDSDGFATVDAVFNETEMHNVLRYARKDEVSKNLVRLGLKHGRKQIEGTRQSGFTVDLKDTRTRALFTRYGVEPNEPKKQESGL